ncbi:hypothetical protein GYMLUDRAFT_239104 [Collybiopsis luxurians FD-317 M1]|nr:hypothetical protein GYMLUDRAFT_239104 [Collybiopsis luxurians FD-317 M1]
MSLDGHFMESAVEYHLRRQCYMNYIDYAKLALLIYEILINLDREVHLVWYTCDKFRWSNILYFVSRLSSFVYPAKYLSKFFWYFSFAPTRLAVIISLTLHAYAVAKNLVFALVLSILGLAIFALDIVSIRSYSGLKLISYNSLVFLRLRSTEASNLPDSSNEFIPLHASSAALSYIALTAFDLIATSLVTRSMVHAIRESGGFKKLRRHDLLEYILTSGILYFGAVTVPQLIAVALYFAPHGLYSSFLNNFVLLSSSLMTARFLLGLREMGKAPGEPEDMLHFSSLLTEPEFLVDADDLGSGEPSSISSPGALTYIVLTAFDLVATALMLMSVLHVIQKAGGFGKLGRHNLLDYILKSGEVKGSVTVPLSFHSCSDVRVGILYLGAVTIPQLIAVALYFAPHVGVMNFLYDFLDVRDTDSMPNAFQGLYSSLFNNFILLLSAIMNARFLLGLREMKKGSLEPADVGQALGLLSEPEFVVDAISLDQLSSINNALPFREVVTRYQSAERVCMIQHRASGTRTYRNFCVIGDYPVRYLDAPYLYFELLAYSPKVLEANQFEAGSGSSARLLSEVIAAW